MKKLTTIFTALLLFLLSSSFAYDTSVSAKIQSVFEKDFTACSDVKWTQYEDVYIATFKSHELYLTAAYNDAGELLAVTRYITISQLPLKVYRALQEKYSTYTIDPNVIELTGEQTSYFINVENEKFIFQIKVDASGYPTIAKRTKKKATNTAATTTNVILT